MVEDENKTTEKEQETTDTKQETTEQTKTEPKVTEKVTNDVDKIISELEKDMLAQKEQNYNEFKAKFEEEYGKKLADKDKDIEALRNKIEEIDKVYKEEQKKIIDNYKEEMKAKFDNIEKTLSQRQSTVADSNNPFRKLEANKPKDGWLNDPNLTEQEKLEIFMKTTLGK